jgi:glutamate synthase domain-containing protein 2
MRLTFILFAVISLTTVILLGLFWPAAFWLLLLLVPLVLRGIIDMRQKRHTLLRNFPLLGHARWAMEYFRPFLRQYFFESDTDGTPINRMFRSVIYQRAKGSLDSTPYGTKLDTQRVGYEWIGHSIAALHHEAQDPMARVRVGGPQCSQPYQASIFNISAMSFGALSSNAIKALNKGAALSGRN